MRAAWSSCAAALVSVVVPRTCRRHNHSRAAHLAAWLPSRTLIAFPANAHHDRVLRSHGDVEWVRKRPPRRSRVGVAGRDCDRRGLTVRGRRHDRVDRSGRSRTSHARRGLGPRPVRVATAHRGPRTPSSRASRRPSSGGSRARRVTPAARHEHRDAGPARGAASRRAPSRRARGACGTRKFGGRANRGFDRPLIVDHRLGRARAGSIPRRSLVEAEIERVGRPHRRVRRNLSARPISATA